MWFYWVKDGCFYERTTEIGCSYAIINQMFYT